MIKRIISASTALLFMAFSGPLPAQAQAVTALSEVHEVSSTVDQGCLSSNGYGTGLPSQACETITTFDATYTRVLVPLAVARLGTLQAATPIYQVTWSLIQDTLVSREVQRGVAYYDGTYAWSTNTRRGITGEHRCHTSGGYAAGATFSNIDCTTSTSVSGASLVDRETYDLTVGTIIPVTTVHAFSILLNCNGAIQNRQY
jgi:hypothetical protein